MKLRWLKCLLLSPLCVRTHFFRGASPLLTLWSLSRILWSSCEVPSVPLGYAAFMMDTSHYRFSIILPAVLSFYWKPLTLSFAVCGLRGKEPWNETKLREICKHADPGWWWALKVHQRCFSNRPGHQTTFCSISSALLGALVGGSLSVHERDRYQLIGLFFCFNSPETLTGQTFWLRQWRDTDGLWTTDFLWIRSVWKNSP